MQTQWGTIIVTPEDDSRKAKPGRVSLGVGLQESRRILSDSVCPLRSIGGGLRCHNKYGQCLDDARRIPNAEADRLPGLDGASKGLLKRVDGGGHLHRIRQAA